MRTGEPYYLGFLLLGAYQETLGDMHNLFGVVNELHVGIEPDGRLTIGQPVRGDRVRDVWAVPATIPESLREAIARRLADAKSPAKLATQQSMTC